MNKMFKHCRSRLVLKTIHQVVLKDIDGRRLASMTAPTENSIFLSMGTSSTRESKIWKIRSVPPTQPQKKSVDWDFPTTDVSFYHSQWMQRQAKRKTSYLEVECWFAKRQMATGGQ